MASRHVHPRYGVGAATSAPAPESKARGSAVDVALAHVRVRYEHSSVGTKLVMLIAIVIAALIFLAPSLLLFDDMMMRDRGFTARLRRKLSHTGGSTTSVRTVDTEDLYSEYESYSSDAGEAAFASQQFLKGGNDAANDDVSAVMGGGDDAEQLGVQSGNDGYDASDATMEKLFAAPVAESGEHHKKRRRKRKKQRQQQQQQQQKSGLKGGHKKKRKQRQKQKKQKQKRSKQQHQEEAHAEAEVAKLQLMKKEHKAHHATVLDAAQAMIAEKGLSKPVPEHVQQAVKEQSNENTKALRAALKDSAVPAGADHPDVDAPSTEYVLLVHFVFPA